MRIGIYKQGLPEFSYDSSIDKNSRYLEVEQLMLAFRLQDIDVEYVDKRKQYDIIYCFAGVANPEVNELDSYRRLQKRTKLLYVLLTETTCKPDSSDYKWFDGIFTMSQEPLFKIPELQKKSTLWRLPLVGMSPESLKPHNSRNIEYIYGGGIRKRQGDFDEYIFQTELDCVKLIKTSESDTRVSADKYREILKDSKYSIVIQDPWCNQHGWNTHRFFECVSCGVLPLMDNKCDRNNVILSPIAFLRVNNRAELINRIELMEKYPLFKKQIFENLFTKDDIDGTIIVDSLLRRIGNVFRG